MVGRGVVLNFSMRLKLRRPWEIPLGNETCRAEGLTSGLILCDYRNSSGGVSYSISRCSVNENSEQVMVPNRIDTAGDAVAKALCATVCWFYAKSGGEPAFLTPRLLNFLDCFMLKAAQYNHNLNTDQLRVRKVGLPPLFLLFCAKPRSTLGDTFKN